MENAVYRDEPGTQYDQFRVVLLDDDQEITAFAEDILECIGCQVAAANTFAEFELALDEDVHLIVLDLEMPGRDGLEVMEYLAEQEIAAPVLIVSSKPKDVIRSAESLARLRGLRMAGWLTKPFKPEEYGARVTQILNQQSGRFTSADLYDLASDPSALVMHYQPKYCLKDQRIIGLEALARLMHPTRGLLGPGQFIPKLDATAGMEVLTDNVINQVVSVMQRGRPLAGLPSVAINVSAASLEGPRLVNVLRETTAKAAVNPSRLVIEVTEDSMAKLHLDAMHTLTRLRVDDVTVSLDDFGSGYATEDRLMALPFNEVKVDRSLIQAMDTDQDAAERIRQLLLLAAKRGLKTVAEGVETRRQLTQVREMGFDMAQGFVLGKPAPASASHLLSTQQVVFD